MEGKRVLLRRETNSMQEVTRASGIAERRRDFHLNLISHWTQASTSAALYTSRLLLSKAMAVLLLLSGTRSVVTPSQ